MAETLHPDVAVETPTTYTDEIDAQHPITINITSLDPEMYVELCQRLSLILEEPFDTPHRRFSEPIVAMHDTFPVEAVRGDTSETGSYCIVIEVEGLSEEGQRLAVSKLNQAVRTDDLQAARRFLEVLAPADRGDGRRSLVRLVRNDGSARPDLEWHTAV